MTKAVKDALRSEVEAIRHECNTALDRIGISSNTRRTLEHLRASATSILRMIEPTKKVEQAADGANS